MKYCNTSRVKSTLTCKYGCTLDGKSCATAPAKICNPTATQCKSGSTTVKQTCNSTGTQWVDSSCPFGQICKSGGCYVSCTSKGGTCGTTLSSDCPGGVLYAPGSSDCLSNFCCKPAVQVSSITVSPTSNSIREGQSFTISTIVAPTNATNKSLLWISNNSNVATVNVNGIVTAKTPGTATITVSSQDGSLIKRTVAVTVTQAVATTCSYKGVTYAIGKAICQDNNVPAECLSTGAWKTFGACAHGCYGEGFCNVWISNITLVPTSKTITVGESFDITTTIFPTNATNKKLSRTSNRASIAAVDVNGKVTGISPGLAVIAVTSLDGSNITRTVAVTVSGCTSSSCGKCATQLECTKFSECSWGYNGSSQLYCYSKTSAVPVNGKCVTSLVLRHHQLTQLVYKERLKINLIILGIGFGIVRV